MTPPLSLTCAVALGATALACASPVQFERRVLTDRYFCDGINAGDFNQDGHVDIVAGPFWYEGPAFVRRHEFYPAQEFPTPPSPTDSLYSFVHDFNGDQWPDILVLGRVHLHQALWYENPQGAAGHWKKHFVHERVQGESPAFGDVDGDGRPELVGIYQGQWGLVQPEPADPTRPWRFRAVMRRSGWHHFYHGTGLGDVNGDGRVDLILNDGWWEQPAAAGANAGTGEWIEHPHLFSVDRGGAQMFAYDVDGDGDRDILTSLNAHGWGLAWFEQVRDAGVLTFREHKFMGDRSQVARYGVAFSQPHALALADLDGDGLEDLLVGKRLWAHGPKGDVEPDAAPVLYWFQLRREPGGRVRYVPHLIDDRSGVGCQVVATDVDADGHPDVLTVSKLGAFVFLNQPAGALRPTPVPIPEPSR